MDKGPDAFRTISEVAESMDLPQHVLRFWETRFPQIKPLKRGGGRRYYRPDDVDLLRAIKRFLYDEGYTIKGVQKMLKEQGAASLSRAAVAPETPRPAPATPPSARIDPPLHRPEAVEPVEPIYSPRPTAPRAAVADLSPLRAALADLREAGRLLAQARVA